MSKTGNKFRELVEADTKKRERHYLDLDAETWRLLGLIADELREPGETPNMSIAARHCIHLAIVVLRSELISDLDAKKASINKVEYTTS